jgi:hypothetical protein
VESKRNQQEELVGGWGRCQRKMGLVRVEVDRVTGVARAKATRALRNHLEVQEPRLGARRAVASR